MANEINPGKPKKKVDSSELADKQASIATGKELGKLREGNFKNAMQGGQVSATKVGVDRFITYGSKTFGKLGFDPNRDNAEFYNNRTSTSDEMWRSVKGAWNLAGVGFQDSIFLGAVSDKNSSQKFSDIMADYQVDERRGNTAFWGNTITSAGYTAGIIGAIAIEEIGLGIATGGLGLLGSGGIVGRGIDNIFTGLGKSKLAKVAGGGRTHIEMMEGLAEVERAREAYDSYSKLKKVGLSLGEFGKDIAKGLNPIGNTAGFLKDLEKMNDVNGFVKMANGAGALYRDARKFTMTHSESKLEAEMNSKEFFNKELDALYKKNPGAEISELDLEDLKSKTQNVFEKTYNANFALIYATTAIAFDNVFRNLKFNQNWLKSAEAGKNSMRNIGKSSAEFVTENLGINLSRGLKNYAKRTFSIGGLTRATLGNIAEGYQELQQDGISTSAVSFAKRSKVTKQTEGNYFTNLYNELADNFDFVANGLEYKFIPKTGRELSTFLSGAFMGVIASPVSMVTQGAQKLTLGKGYKSFSKSYREEQAKSNSKNQAIAKVLNMTFRENLDKAYDVVNKPLFTQIELQEKILEAVEKGDTKALEDLKDATFAVQANMLLETNADEDFAEHLDQAASKLNDSELAEFLGRTNIDAENSSKVRKVLKDKATTLKKLRAVKNEIDANVVSPINPNLLNKKDPEYAQKYHTYQAFQSLKKELLYSHAAILQNVNRTEGIRSKLLDNSKNINFSSFEVEALLSSADLKSQVELLKTEIESVKSIGSSRPESKKELEVLEKKLVAYTEYQKAYEKLKTTKDSNSEEYADSVDAVQEAFQNVAKAYNERTTNRFLEVEGMSTDIVDYLTLGEERDALQQHVNLLTNKDYAFNFITEAEKQNKKALANLQNHIEDSLNEFDKRKAANTMMKILSEKGIIFDMNEIDDLFEKGIMPSKIYDIAKNSFANSKQVAEAQTIISSIYKNLTGKSILNDKSKITRAGSQRADNDTRTVKNIIKEYGLKMDEDIDLSTPAGKRIIKKVLNSNKLRATDVEILNELLEKGGVIKFVTNAELPITFEKGVTTIDLRFAGADYKGTTLSFEGLFTTALLQDKVARRITTDSEFAGEVTQLMQQTKQSLIDKDQSAPAAFFTDPVLFLVEAMNNRALQREMQSIKDDTQVSEKSIWASMAALIKRIIKSTLANDTLLERAVYLTKTATSDGELIKVEAKNEEESAVETEQEVQQEEPTTETELGFETDPVLNLENRIDQLKVELAVYENELRKVNKLTSFRKYSQLQKKIAGLNIMINDLSVELNDLVPAEVVDKPKPFSPVNRVADEDQYGNIILNENAPLNAFPKDILNELSNIYGKDVTTLKDYEEEELRKLISQHPLIIKILKAHNDDVYSIADEYAILTSNEQAMEEGKLLAEKRAAAREKSIQDNKEEARKNATLQEDMTPKDILWFKFEQAGLSTDNLRLLTDKQAETLFVKVRAKELDLNDVFKFVEKKKLLKDQRATKKFQKELDLLITNEQEDLDKQKEKEDALQKIIDENRKSLADKNIRETKKISEKRSKVVKTNVPKSHILFYETYFPEVLLIEDKIKFIEFINNVIKARVNNGRVKAKAASFSKNKNEALNQLVDLFIELDHAKELFPTVANTINKQLRASNLPYRITMTPTNKGEQLVGSMYKIRHVGDIKKRISKPKRILGVNDIFNYSQKREFVKSYLPTNLNGEAAVELAVIQWFLSGGRVSSEFITSQVGSDSSELKAKKSLISANGKNRLDTILDDYIDILDVDITENVAISLLNDYSTIKEMVEGMFDAIKANIDSEENQQGGSEDENWNNFINSEEGSDFLKDMYEDASTYEKEELNLLEFYASPEGKKYTDAYNKNVESYYNSTLFQIEMGAFEGDPNTLEGAEREAYMTAVKENRYENKLNQDENTDDTEDVSQKPKKETAETKDALIFEEKLNKEFDIFYNKVLTESSGDLFNKPNFVFYNTAVAKLEKDFTLKNLILTLAAFNQFGSITPAQHQKFSSEMVNKISEISTANSKEILIINNKAYELLPGLNNKQVQLKEIGSDEIILKSFEELPLVVSNVNVSGDNVKSKTAVDVEKDEEFEPVKDALLNVFGNFKKLFESGEIPDNLNGIKEEIIKNLNNCK